jgi:hypothetical protein
MSLLRAVGQITDKNNPLCPCVEEVLVKLYVGSAVGRKVLLDATVLKGVDVLLKLNYDGTHRLVETLVTMRASRLFDYCFVANTSLPTLIEEIAHLNVLPNCINMIEFMSTELPAYQTLAQAECAKDVSQRKGLWKFWVFHELHLPFWYACGAKYVALIQPSSGCSERVFAMTMSLFGESQASCLEDRREATVMIRMNKNWRMQEIKQLE